MSASSSTSRVWKSGMKCAGIPSYILRVSLQHQKELNMAQYCAESKLFEKQDFSSLSLTGLSACGDSAASAASEVAPASGLMCAEAPLPLSLTSSGAIMRMDTSVLLTSV